MTILSVGLIALSCAYAAVLVWLWAGFRKVCRQDMPAVAGSGCDPAVSVIVPARNEAAHIIPCLQSIFANDYRHFEVVVVDDDSEDETAVLAQQFADVNELGDRLSVVLAGQEKGLAATGHKKRALSLGIERSRGEIIVTTDADSLVPPGWIRSLVSHFDDGVEFVSAPVAYLEGRSVLDRAVALEMLGLVAVGGGGISNGQPNMCNGANLAYRRRAFDRVGGFSSIDHLASGDDALLMLKMSADNPDAVRFCPDMSALVTTRPATGFRGLIEQRRRWASKGLHYDDRAVTALAVLVYCFHLALLATFVAVVIFPQFWPVLGIAFCSKLVSEGLLLHTACSQFDRGHLMKGFVPAQILQVPYVVVIGFLGVFGGGFSWKGRELAR